MVTKYICLNESDKTKNLCLKCRYCGIASKFINNVNLYIIHCTFLGKAVDEESTRDCHFSQIGKSYIEIKCSQHDIPLPDWIDTYDYE